jgi:hypothetical protein
VQLSDLTTAAGFFVGLMAAWLYLAGWTYAYTYFDRFRLPLLMLDLPYEHLLIYGFLVLRRHLWWVVGLAIIVLAGCVFWPALARHLLRCFHASLGAGPPHSASSPRLGRARAS